MKSTSVGVGVIESKREKIEKFTKKLERTLGTTPDVKKPQEEVVGDRTVFRTQSGKVKT